MKCFGLTDKGRVRKDNQDSFIIEKCEAKNCLIVGLCDGMGGAKAGGLASQLSNKAFVDFVYGKLTSRVERVQNYKDMLQSACDEANGVSYEYSKFDEAYNGMGTTIVGGVIKNSGKAHIINVGDSRAYHFSQQGVRQLSCDHSVVELMVQRGELTREQAKNYPGKNLITRAVGTEPQVEGDIYVQELKKDDCILLCSDGLSNEMADQEMLFEVVHGMSKSDCCQRLLHIAKNRGAPDNVTVTLAAV